MSLISTSPAERLGTDIKPLPDGRARFTVREEMAACFRVTDDAMTAYGTLIDKPITGKYTRAAAAYLIDQDFVNQGGSVIRIRVYETLHATDEVQAGKLTTYTDEDGRQRGRAEFLQRSSATRTPGTIGTTTAPSVSSLVLATEQAADDGALRRITREYTQTNASAGTAEVVGPVVVTYPFNQLGDETHCIASQVYEQPATHYAPLALNSSRTVTVGGSSTTLYYTGDIDRVQRQGSTLVRFTRQWANTPSTRSEYETRSVPFPGLATTTAEYAAKQFNKTRARDGFTEVVRCRITYTFYRIAASGGDYTSPESIPLDTEQKYYVNAWGTNPKSPFDMHLNDGESYDGFNWFQSTPSRTTYNALGSFGLIVSSTYQRYLGPFYVRITVRCTPL